MEHLERDTYLSYRNFVWLWICVGVVFLMGVIYLIDEPVGGRSGGSVLGYTYGTIATLGIMFLMWYGIRKRAYYSRYTTLKATLAAHVWIGVALVFIVPMHCAFSFGLNVHTLAYVLMCLVVFSGIWGVVMYSEEPMQIRSQRGGGTPKQLLEQVKATSDEINELLGLSATTQKSDSFLKLIQSIDFTFKPSLMKSLRRQNPTEIDSKRMATLLNTLPKSEQDDGLKLIRLANKKRDLVTRIQDEARAQTWVRAWLYLHLPISFGLVAALVIHIFTVFYYW